MYQDWVSSRFLNWARYMELSSSLAMPILVMDRKLEIKSMMVGSIITTYSLLHKVHIPEVCIRFRYCFAH